MVTTASRPVRPPVLELLPCLVVPTLTGAARMVTHTGTAPRAERVVVPGCNEERAVLLFTAFLARRRVFGRPLGALVLPGSAHDDRQEFRRKKGRFGDGNHWNFTLGEKWQGFLKPR